MTMRQLSHHVYTSFGGQRTAFLSPELESLRNLLEDRARQAYPETGHFDCVHQDGRWIATFVIANGVDHVNRPRSLVHQLVIGSHLTPAVFSPLFLRAAALPRLEHDNPALGHRLAADLDQIDLRSQMPAPDDLNRLLRGRMRPLMTAMLRALANDEAPIRQQVTDFSSQHADFAAASAALLVHAPDIQLSSLAHPLSPPDPSQPLARLFLLPDTERRMVSETMFIDQGVFAAAEELLDLIVQTPQPPRILFLLRLIPLPSLLKHGLIRELKTALLAAAPRFERDGQLQLDPLDPRSYRVLLALAAAGASVPVGAVLADWRAVLADGPVDPGWVAACQACEANPEPLAVEALCKAIPGAGHPP